MTAMLHIIQEQNWEGLIGMLSNAVNSLARAGADFAFIASNTPHIVFGQIRRASPIPLLSIVEAARLEAERQGLRKAGLLGTVFTMRSSFYQEEFRKSGIELVVPNGEEQKYIQEKLFQEIERGVLLEETKAGLLKIVQRLKRDAAIDGVILACTELPLILTQDQYGLPFLNTTEIHVRRIMEKYMQLHGA
jgi:aspartate racemase